MERPNPPLTVKPRHPTRKWLPIIALTNEEIYLERTGEVLPSSELERVFRREPPSFVAVHGAGRLVKRLHGIFKDHPDWQFRLSPVHREVYRPNRELNPRVSQRDSTVAFFGFRNGKKRKGAGRYFYPIDPITLVNKSVGELIPNEAITPEVARLTQGYVKAAKLLVFARDVREFCLENGLTPRPTSGGIAAQLLRDGRFYPEPRRKVPAATNARAREHLPGNYYKLLTEPRERVSAFYLDQNAAHHSCARELEFPCSRRLRGKGRFRHLQDKPWAIRGTARYEAVLREYGMFYVQLSVPHRRPRDFPPPYMEKAGLQLAFIYSNEIPYIREIGAEIEYVIAAWSSADRDLGLNRYAEWSLTQLQEVEPERRSWLKPTLLSTYGILAAKPRPVAFGFNQAKGGERKSYPVGGGRLEVWERGTVKARETPTVNVIHRAMVEAETRLRSLRLARELSGYGLTVLSVYADSVFILDDGTPLPFLPSGWSIKDRLTDLRFFTSTAFTSRELTKLPGISKEDHDRVSRMEATRNLQRIGDRAACLPDSPDVGYELARRRGDFDLTDADARLNREPGGRKGGPR